MKSEHQHRQDTLELVVAGNDAARQAAAQLRKSVNDTTGVGWTRSPEDWSKIERSLGRAIEKFRDARSAAQRRAREVSEATTEGREQ